ncbi:MAG: hypothetical protein ABIP51_12380 [Bacteroidia bacterium]
MNLLAKLIEKNLNENYKYTPSDVIIKFFHIINKEKNINKQYALTEKHLLSLKLFLKAEINKHFEIEDEKFTIAGGSVLTLIMYASPFLIKDIDLFPCSEEDYNKLKVKLDKSAKLNQVESFQNENSISYDFKGIKIDLIKKYYKTVDECISSFDLSIVQMGFDQKFWFTSIANFGDVFNFKMHMVKTPEPKLAFTRLRRIIKYSEKGFKIRNNDLMTLFALIKSNETEFIKNEVGEIIFNQNYSKAFEEAEEEIKKGYHELTGSLNEKIEITTPEDPF